MAKNKTTLVKHRRKREGKTDYKKRLKLLSSNKPRLVIRKSLKNINVQIIEYEPKGDLVRISAHTRELIRYGWRGYRRNLPAAYLVGLLCGLKAKKSKIKEAVLDIGLYASVKGSVLYAALKGVVDAGIKVPHDKGILPPEDRLMGLHTKEPEKSKKNFLEVKEKLLKGLKNEKA
ncbi:MAG: 50S ribosomal protein L18 [Nanoarchaeota archaeon]|nr:50S ribosomal protein L18 [Nanoarchaeota archaeon]